MEKTVDYVIERIEKGAGDVAVSYDDQLELEWYEVNKSRHSGTTSGGKKLLVTRDNPSSIEEGDVLISREGHRIRAVINSCDCIVVYPRSRAEVGLIAFLIGNLHLPLFSDSESAVFFAYDARIFNLLDRKGYALFIENRKLLAKYRVAL